MARQSTNRMDPLLEFERLYKMWQSPQKKIHEKLFGHKKEKEFLEYQKRVQKQFKADLAEQELQEAKEKAESVMSKGATISTSPVLFRDECSINCSLEDAKNDRGQPLRSNMLKTNQVSNSFESSLEDQCSASDTIAANHESLEQTGMSDVDRRKEAALAGKRASGDSSSLALGLLRSVQKRVEEVPDHPHRTISVQ